MDWNAVRDAPRPGTQASPASSTTARWVVFRLESRRYALPLSSVVRVVRAALVTPLPLAPGAILGAIDVEGDILPVFNLRRRFQLREKPLEPADHFLLARTDRRAVALLIDDAVGVIEYPVEAVIEADALAPDLAHVRGVLRLADGLVVIQNLESFLSVDEATALETVLSEPLVRSPRA